MARFLLIFQILLISSCASTQYVCTPVDTAPRPSLIPITQEQWERIPPDVQDTLTVNDLALKEAIKLNEANIEAHNEVCQ